MKNNLLKLVIFSSFLLTFSTASAQDTDGDGILNSVDLDDDNDGILDCIERGLGNASISSIFKLNGNATVVSNNEAQLTADLGSQAGQMWSYGKVDFAQSFTLSYSAYLGVKDATGADGLAAVFHNSPLGVNAVGGNAAGIGALNIANGIVLELDTWDNGSTVGDIVDDHGHIWDSDNQTNSGFLSTAVSLGNIEDGAWHNVVITWNFATKTLSYTVGSILAGTHTFTASTPITSYFGGVSMVYFGYTASTGGSSNIQSVRFNNFCSDLPLVLDSDNDGILNHLDLDSDGDGCFDAIEGDENVRPIHLNSNGSIRTNAAGTPNGNNIATIDANGIPTLVSSGGVADTGPDIGQGIGDSQSSVANTQCIDTDGDGYPNNLDLDDDNDGILDTVEDACATEGAVVFSNTFLTGATTGTDNNVLLHSYQAVSPADGSYSVTTSNAQGSGTTSTHTRTDLTGSLDAGNPNITAGSTDGRYLAININSSATAGQAIYRVTNLATVVGTRYRLRIDMAGLANGAADVPNLQLSIKDSNGNILATSNSNILGVANDDVWRRLVLNFIASTSSVILEIVNLQSNGASGNDVGIDNIVLVPLNICDTDADGIPNSLDLDSDGDGCFDALEGDENVIVTQLNANGSINITANGGVNTNGIPNLVNAGGAADIGADIGQGNGDSQNNLINLCYCYKQPVLNAGTTLPTKHGITGLNRANSGNNDWPNVRQSAWTVLESRTNGFVVNRMAFVDADNNPNTPTTPGLTVIPVANYIEGMMVYDTVANCLKIYNGAVWNCYNTQTCPN